MSVQCCECRLMIGQKDGEGVSHGICRPCMRKNHRKAYDANRERYAMELGARASFSPLLNSQWRKSFPQSWMADVMGK